MLTATYTGQALEAGLDEAGRGCLAGPVFAAAVILPPTFNPRFLNDSKQLSAKRREALRPEICAEAIAWAVGQASVTEIEGLNIAQASYLAMHRAVAALAIVPSHLLVDGNRFRPLPGFAHTCVIGGDGLYRNIAAASILAKTFRDEHMAQLAEEFPAYGWSQNAGYPHPKPPGRHSGTWPQPAPPHGVSPAVSPCKPAFAAQLFSLSRSRNKLNPSTLVPPSPKLSKLRGLMM